MHQTWPRLPAHRDDTMRRPAASVFARALWAGALGAATLVCMPRSDARADEPVATPPAEVERVIETRIAARYGHPGRCRKAARPEWAGFPLVHCRYEVGGITAEVLLVDTTPARIARWIVGACGVIAAPDLGACAERLRRHVETVSFYQFPVAGMVLEDLDPNVPGVEGYAFRDGVTVAVDGFTNGSGGQPSTAAIRATIVEPPRQALRYARLQSTTREDYRKNGGQADVGTSAAHERKLAWLDVVRTTFQAAWNEPNNELMVAWARAHAQLLVTPAK